MKKYLVIGIVIGIMIAVGVGFGVSVVSAQGPFPNAPTVAQMQQMHESVHGAGTWDTMVQQMERAFGKDWFNQMHGSNGMMNGTGMMNSQNHMGAGGMMGSGTNTPATK